MSAPCGPYCDRTLSPALCACAASYWAQRESDAVSEKPPLDQSATKFQKFRAFSSAPFFSTDSSSALTGGVRAQSATLERSTVFAAKSRARAMDYSALLAAINAERSGVDLRCEPVATSAMERVLRGVVKDIWRQPRRCWNRCWRVAARASSHRRRHACRCRSMPQRVTRLRRAWRRPLNVYTDAMWEPELDSPAGIA